MGIIEKCIYSIIQSSHDNKYFHEDSPPLPSTSLLCLLNCIHMGLYKRVCVQGCVSVCVCVCVCVGVCVSRCVRVCVCGWLPIMCVSGSRDSDQLAQEPWLKANTGALHGLQADLGAPEGSLRGDTVPWSPDSLACRGCCGLRPGSSGRGRRLWLLLVFLLACSWCARRLRGYGTTTRAGRPPPVAGSLPHPGPYLLRRRPTPPLPYGQHRQAFCQISNEQKT